MKTKKIILATLIILISGIALDMATTEYCLSNGIGTESNSIIRIHGTVNGFSMIFMQGMVILIATVILTYLYFTDKAGSFRKCLPIALCPVLTAVGLLYLGAGVNNVIVIILGPVV